MRLIDADALRYEIAKYFDGLPIQVHYDMLKMVDEAPTIEAEPVKRGKWFYDEIADEYLVYRCSACNIPSTLDTPYCPWCGARMSERSEE